MNYRIFDKDNNFIPLFYSLYHYQIKEYYSRFDSKQILLLSFEKFTENPEAVVREVFEFLNIDPEFPLDISKMNIHTGKQYPSGPEAALESFMSKAERKKMIKRLHKDLRLLKKDFGFDTSDWEIK